MKPEEGTGSCDSGIRERFFLHVLPKGFVRIRHYGLLSNRFRKQLLPPGTHLARRPRLPPAHSAAPDPRRTLALSPLRKSHARRPTLQPRPTLLRRLRFLMTAYDNAIRRLAPRTHPHPCVRNIQQQVKTISTGGPQTPDRTSLAHLLTGFHHQQQKRRTQNHSAKDQMIFNIHNPK